MEDEKVRASEGTELKKSPTDLGRLNEACTDHQKRQLTPILVKYG